VKSSTIIYGILTKVYSFLYTLTVDIKGIGLMLRIELPQNKLAELKEAQLNHSKLPARGSKPPSFNVREHTSCDHPTTAWQSQHSSTALSLAYIKQAVSRCASLVSAA
jgi:hypothetical protein